MASDEKLSEMSKLVEQVKEQASQREKALKVQLKEAIARLKTQAVQARR